jgi:hypothetical protein
MYICIQSRMLYIGWRCRVTNQRRVETIWCSIHSPNTILQLIFVSLSKTVLSSTFMLGFSCRLQTYNDMADIYDLWQVCQCISCLLVWILAEERTHAHMHTYTHRYISTVRCCAYLLKKHCGYAYVYFHMDKHISANIYIMQYVHI